MMDGQQQKDRVRGCLVGGAVGDALGYAVEFVSSYQGIVNFYGPQGITRLDTNNDTGKGVISDDTQMTSGGAGTPRTANTDKRRLQFSAIHKGKSVHLQKNILIKD